MSYARCKRKVKAKVKVKAKRQHLLKILNNAEPLLLDA